MKEFRDRVATVTASPGRPPNHESVDAGIVRSGTAGRGPSRWGRGGVVSSNADLMRALHDEHAQSLWSYVIGLTGGDRFRAQDVVQETMLRAWRNPKILQQADGSVRSWLFTVAKRIVIDEWRSTQRRPEVVTDSPPELSVPDATDTADNRGLVTEALRRLSEDHRQVLLECYICDSSVDEAARRLGIPPGTVKSRTHYALRAFKLAMAEIGGVS